MIKCALHQVLRLRNYVLQESRESNQRSQSVKGTCFDDCANEAPDHQVSVMDIKTRACAFSFFNFIQSANISVLLHEVS